MRRDENRKSRDWFVSGRRGATLSEDLGIFLQEIARGRGFIAIVDDVMPKSGCLSAEEFAISMLLAEGFEEPADELTFRPDLEKLFRERYGPRVCEADFRAW